MPEEDHCAGGHVAKPTSRRKEKKAAKKRERGQSDKALANAAAALHNSRARRLHQIMRRPGRGGLTSKGAQQLRQYFSRRVPKNEKLSLNEMDESAVMIMLQMAAEEVDEGKLSYKDLRRVTEERFGNGAEDREGGSHSEDRTVEGNVETKEAIELKESLRSKEEQELGKGAAMANEFKLCIRTAEKRGLADAL